MYRAGAGAKVLNESPMIDVIDGDDAIRDSIAMLLQVEGFVVHLYPSGVAFLREANWVEAPERKSLTD